MKYFFLFTLFLLTLKGLQAQNPPAEIPAFSFKTVEGKTFTKESLKAGIPTIFFYFDPGCDHCQEQSKLIKAEITKFAGSQIVMITMEDDNARINEFKNKYYAGVTNPSITFIKDSMMDIDKYFGRCEVPTIMVYDKNRKFKKVFKKEGNTEFKEVAAAMIASFLK